MRVEPPEFSTIKQMTTPKKLEALFRGTPLKKVITPKTKIGTKDTPQQIQLHGTLKNPQSFTNI